MPVRGEIHYVGSPESTLRQLRPTVKTHLKAIGSLWHKEFLPRHFRRGAQRRYGYQRRSQRYLKRKQRAAERGMIPRSSLGKPLVFTGVSEEQISRRSDITSTSKRARVKMSAPKHFFQHRKDYGQSDKVEEVTRIVEQEATAMAKELSDAIAATLNENQETEVKRF